MFVWQCCTFIQWRHNRDHIRCSWPKLLLLSMVQPVVNGTLSWRVVVRQMLICVQRLTNLEDRNVLVSFHPLIVSSRQDTFQAPKQSLTHSLARGTSKKLVKVFKPAGFSFLQGFSFDAVIDEGYNGTKGTARYPRGLYVLLINLIY